MYMECELLSVYSQTNSTGGLTKAAQTGMTNVSARLESIVAETNVLIMARDTTILGDKAIYTASNEVVVVRGILVIIETDKSYTYGEHFVFNRSTGKGYAIGPTVVEIKMEGTNAFKPSFGLGKKPAPAANPPAGGTK